MTRPANLLAVCTGGGVGDLLAATPAISALARHFQTRPAVLASPYAASIVEGHPAVGSILTDDGRTPLRELTEMIRTRDFTHAVVFWSNARVAALVQRARIPVRVGQASRLYSLRFTERVRVRTEAGDTTSHWTDVQMDYARALGARPQKSDYRISIDVRPTDVAEADAVLARAGVAGRFAVLHAARGIALDAVAWPTARFAAIGDALAAAFDMPVLLTGGESDRRAIEAIGAAMRLPHRTIAGQTSLRGLAALLAKAAFVAALDSGPMHIAAAVGAPTVGIFALRTDFPNRWRPLGERVAVIEPTYPCPRFCRKETCRTFDCYAALEPATVVAAARSLLSAVTAGARPPQTA